RYKEAGARGGTQRASGDYDRRISWMRQLLSWGSDDGSESAGVSGNDEAQASDAAQAPSHASSERIYVMTPQARVIELPEGATPVDFAYYLHTDLGHRCRGARVDGQMVPLLTRLHTG